MSNTKLAKLTEAGAVAELHGIAMRARYAMPFDQTAFRLAYKDWSTARKSLNETVTRNPTVAS
jgi:hypothetical protein